MTPWRTRWLGRWLSPRPHPSAGQWVGLDLGSQSIKLVELEFGSGGSASAGSQTTPVAGVRLRRQLIQELPRTAQGEPIDSAGWLQSALKEFSARQVHVAVSGPNVAVRRIRIPPMSTREMPEAIKWQVKDQLPFPIQDAVLDFKLVGEVWDKDLRKLDVLVAAAPKPFLEERIAEVERAGASVASLIPTAAALAASASALIPGAGHGSLVLIDIGAQTTHVAIMKDGWIRVVRDLAVGSLTMSQALVGSVTSDRGEVIIDLPLAEIFKRRYGVLTESAEGVTEQGVPLFHIASLMRPVLEGLLTELSRLLDFYKVQMEDEGVSRVLLCGGGATVKSLQTFLADGLGVTVELFNPLMRISDRAQSLETEQIADGGPKLAVAVGAALDHGRSLNLLPTSARRAGGLLPALEMSPRLGGLARAAAIGALVCYAALVGLGWLLEWRVRRAEQAWAAVEGHYAHSVQVNTSRRMLEDTMQQVDRFIKTQPVWDGMLKELGALVPKPIELELIAVRGGDRGLMMTLRGHLIGSAEGSIAEFVQALEDSIFFQKMTLTSSEMHSSQAGRSTFTVEGLLE